MAFWRTTAGNGDDAGALPFVQLRFSAGSGAVLQGTFQTAFHKALPYSSHGRYPNIQCCRDRVIFQAFVRLEQHPRPRQRSRSVFPLADQSQQLALFFFRQIHTGIDE